MALENNERSTEMESPMTPPKAVNGRCDQGLELGTDQF